MSSRASISSPLKRKQSTQPEASGRQVKRVRMQSARAIASQTSGKAFGNGELDVDKFIRAREAEIKALEQGLKRARSSLSSRAFQNVPRELRRRTASHNVKRVPKRLRPRAKQEMVEDNTPTVSARRRKLDSHGWLRLQSARQRKLSAIKTRLRKEQIRKERQAAQNNGGTHVPDLQKNTLQRPSMPKAKFRKRQKFKAWLPTHLFHAKRAHMTAPKEPLWRMTIPLSPTQKCYKSAHRATHSRGAVAWDMSYMATIGLIGVEASILGVLKCIGICSTSKTSKWLAGTRSWEGWCYMDRCDRPEPIAPIQVLWRCMLDDERPEQDKKKSKREVFIRVHPSAFMQLWGELLKAAKAQQPNISLEDLRFEIGSIDVAGPAAIEALIGTLWPVSDLKSQSGQEPQDIWYQLRWLSSPAQLPSGATLGFDIVDPRLHHPLRSVNTEMETESQELLLETLSTWPVDGTQRSQHLFERKSRVLASRKLSSQKAINRRKGSARPGTYPEALPSDPSIPLIILAQKGASRGDGFWSVLLPWKCVVPVWYTLMSYPLHSGGRIGLGGLEQKRQLSYEAGVPWFPGDYPGTAAGREWEALERKKRKCSWESRPKGRRIEWEKVDLGKNSKGEIGLGWACDWDYLYRRKADETQQSSEAVCHCAKAQASKILADSRGSFNMVTNFLTTVKITMANKGVANVCARIYRLPSRNTELRQCWMEELGGSGSKSRSFRMEQAKPSVDEAAHERRRYLADMLLADPVGTEVAAGGALKVPDERDLIGFVTTGNFNLTEGKGTCIGSISLDQVMSKPEDIEVGSEEFWQNRQVCIVRNSGQGIGRLGRWELA